MCENYPKIPHPALFCTHNFWPWLAPLKINIGMWKILKYFSRAISFQNSAHTSKINVLRSSLTADSWVSGPDLAPQKMKLFQKFRHLMLSFWDTAICLHFWAKFKMAARGPKRVTGQVFLLFPITKSFFSC